ncbi:MAG: 5-oxoprolinase subunit PxpB [Chthoniobacterales bacterium]|nr:5-oxoprolinase subunit PxpB [Chthoniobacterales bacterium]
MSVELAPLGDSAVIIRLDDSLGEILATARILEAAKICGVIDIAPAFASVAVFFSSPDDRENSTAAIETILRQHKPSPRAIGETRLLEIPVCYEPAYGLDLEIVARHAQLSPNEIALHHSGASYEVRCVGFTPGFPYLSGLPKVLATPRRATPRVAVPPGSVAIGGAQTGIYPLASPGGWNIIGRTPLRLFDAAREPAALLQAGDRVRFFAISGKEFARWEE